MGQNSYRQAAPRYQVGQKLWLDQRVSRRKRRQRYAVVTGVYPRFIKVSFGSYSETVFLQDLADGSVKVEVVG